MKLRDVLKVVERFDTRIKVNAGNEMYCKEVLTLERIHNRAEERFESEYLDWEVCHIDPSDYCELTIWVYKED